MLVLLFEQTIERIAAATASAITAKTAVAVAVAVEGARIVAVPKVASQLDYALSYKWCNQKVRWKAIGLLIEITMYENALLIDQLYAMI